MRLLALAALAACGGSPSHTPSHVDRSTPAAPGEPAAAPSAARTEPAKPVSYPAPPQGPAPTGTWRVTIEVPRLQIAPASIVADASGIYIAAAVLTADDVRMQRWALIKLDGSGAVAWSSIEELARAPAPERLALGGGALVVGGQDSSHETARLLVIERRDPANGKRVWQRRFTARDTGCSQPACAGRDAFGGVALHGSSVVYSATVDRPVEEAYGELTLAKGAPAKSWQTRSDLHARDVAADDSGIYLLEATLSDTADVVKISDGKTIWKQADDSGALHEGIGAGGLLLWSKTVEKRASDTGELAWTSKLVGDHIDVASDASGVYATAMIEAKPAPYYGIAKLDPGTGAVAWVQRTSEYQQSRPSAYVAVDKDAIYLLGFEGEKLYVEKRRKSDGALGEVQTTARTIEPAKRK